MKYKGLVVDNTTSILQSDLQYWYLRHLYPLAWPYAGDQRRVSDRASQPAIRGVDDDWLRKNKPICKGLANDLKGVFKLVKVESLAITSELGRRSAFHITRGCACNRVCHLLHIDWMIEKLFLCLERDLVVILNGYKVKDIGNEALERSRCRFRIKSAVAVGYGWNWSLWCCALTSSFSGNGTAHVYD